MKNFCLKFFFIGLSKYTSITYIIFPHNAFLFAHWKFFENVLLKAIFYKAESLINYTWVIVIRNKLPCHWFCVVQLMWSRVMSFIVINKPYFIQKVTVIRVWAFHRAMSCFFCHSLRFSLFVLTEVDFITDHQANGLSSFRTWCDYYSLLCSSLGHSLTSSWFTKNTTLIVFDFRIMSPVFTQFLWIVNFHKGET